MLRKVASAAVVAVALLVLAGCSTAPRDVATVNGEPISFLDYCALLQIQRGSQGMPIGEAVLHDLIRQKLIVQEAKRLKVYPSSEQIVSEMQAALASGAAVTAFRGLTEVQIRDLFIIPELAYRNLILRQAKLAVKNWDQELRQFFEANRSQFDLPERARVLLIAVPDEKDAQDALQLSRSQSPEAVVSTVMGPDSPFTRPMLIARDGTAPQLRPVADAVFKTPAGSWTPIVRLDRPVNFTQTIRAQFFLAYVLERLPSVPADLANPETRSQVEMAFASTKVPRNYIDEMLQRKLRNVEVHVVPESLKSVEMEYVSQSPVPHQH